MIAYAHGASLELAVSCTFTVFVSLAFMLAPRRDGRGRG